MKKRMVKFRQVKPVIYSWGEEIGHGYITEDEAEN